MDDKEASIQRWEHVVYNKDITEDESLSYYDTWAETYDDDIANVGFQARFLVAEKLKNLFPTMEERKRIKILDVAAGTGLLGVGLAKAGFENLDAVDGSLGMMEKLREKNGVYRNTWIVRLGDKNEQIHQDIQDESYDLVLIMGGFAQSHLPNDSLYQVARAIKKGGIFLNFMSKKYLDIVEKLKDLEPLMAKMESDGIWIKIEVFTDDTQAIPPRWHIYKKL